MASSQGFATEVGLQSLSQALLSIIFESEFEGVLQQLEDLLQEDLHKLGSSATTEADLRSELVSLAGELGDLGEMLQLPAFSNLCEAVIEAVDGASCGMRAIAQAARRAQALVMTQQLDLIPTRLELPLGELATVEPARPDALDNPVPLPAILERFILERFIIEPVRLQPVSFGTIAPNLTVAREPVLPEPILSEPVLPELTQLNPTAFETPDLAAFEAPEAIAPEAIAPDAIAPDDLRTVRVSLKRLKELR
ncbi:MAG: hypothetical protein HC771_13755 [Synechococcales cyanobacterium CRU_2_2]|nr:hypothetical protein [Synechococcales cyanobacterium CRU_2_2]